MMDEEHIKVCGRQQTKGNNDQVSERGGVWEIRSCRTPYRQLIKLKFLDKTLDIVMRL